VIVVLIANENVIKELADAIRNAYASFTYALSVHGSKGCFRWPHEHEQDAFTCGRSALGVLASFMAVQYINKEVAVRTPVDHTETVRLRPVHPMQKGDIPSERLSAATYRLVRPTTL